MGKHQDPDGLIEECATILRLNSTDKIDREVLLRILANIVMFNGTNALLPLEPHPGLAAWAAILEDQRRVAELRAATGLRKKGRPSGWEKKRVRQLLDDIREVDPAFKLSVSALASLLKQTYKEQYKKVSVDTLARWLRRGPPED